MIEKIKKIIKTNYVLGCVIGFILGQLIYMEGCAIATLFSKPAHIIYGAKVVAMIVFFIVVVIWIFINPFKNIKFNRLSVYLIMAILLSLLVSFYSFAIGMGIVGRYFYHVIEKLQDNYFIATNVFILLVIWVVFVFLAVFLSLVNRKVRYIKYLTKEVGSLKEQGFGKQIEVKGKDELGELCQSINHMSRELKDRIDKERLMENNKNELITNVSHDLRTPMTSIMGYVDLIKKDKLNNKEACISYLNIIDEKTKSLNGLINELFEYTKLTSPGFKLNYSSVDITGLMEQIIGEYVVIFEDRGLNLKKNIPLYDIMVNIDIEKMVRVVENLLSNAQKYSIKGTTVLVALKDGEESIEILISNHTTEIKEDELDTIFERFYMGNKSRSNCNSTGLGLSIVKTIVNLHCGEIESYMKDTELTFKLMIPKLKPSSH